MPNTRIWSRVGGLGEGNAYSCLYIGALLECESIRLLFGRKKCVVRSKPRELQTLS